MPIRSLIKGFACAALVTVPAVPAAAREFDDVAGWEMHATAKTCTMTSTFSDDVGVSLVWSPTTSELGFMASLPHSYDLGGQKTTSLSLTFDGNSPYDQWEDQKAAVLTGSESTGVIANWGPEHTGDLAKAVEAASHVSVRVGDREVGRYDLSGSPQAYKALMRCGNLIASK